MSKTKTEPGAPVALARSVATALAAMAMLAACGGGGGGGNVRVDPPPAAPPPPPPPPVVQPPNPAYGGHLRDTNAAAAHQAGFTGAGVRIGIIDSGVNRNHPALAGRVLANLTYISGTNNDLSKDDVVGHGTTVAQAAAGRAFGQWPGGMAPGAQIVSARIIQDRAPDDDGSGQGNEVNGALGLAGVHRDLMARGARIMNNSWGGLYWNNPAATSAIASEYRPYILEFGGLVVFSTGNSGFADPSDMAALPSQPGVGGSLPAAALERGWIAVGALAQDDPTRLADYSNACGLAMNYCMVAPGSVVVTGTDNTPTTPDYWRWNGTSLAAPLVSGAAALVWEAFPWFDNDNVRQTLLGTATDIGQPGVDAVFGHGALDAGRAVRGPARLDWGVFTADFNGGTAVWGNDLSGNGQVVKRGTGTLVLQGHAFNLGGLHVAEGTLQSGPRVDGDVVVGPAGRFVFGTAVGGSVDNAGRTDMPAPADASGLDTTFVGGDYRHRDDAVFAFDIGHVLQVAGAAHLEGGDLHVVGIRSGYTAGGREEVITAAGGVHGAFDRLTWADSVFLEGSIGQGANALWLDITRLDVAAAAATLGVIRPAALASAERVERAFQAIDRQLDGQGSGVSAHFVALAGELQRVDGAERAERALSSLSGEVHAAATGLVFEQASATRRVASSRLEELGMAGAAWRSNGFDGGAAQGSGWVRALGRGGEGGFDAGGFTHQGWLAGRDLLLGDGMAAGFAFGETRAHGGVAGLGDRAHARMASGLAWAGWTRGDAYVLAQAGAGDAHHDIERRLAPGADVQGVASRYGASHASASLEAGRTMHLGSIGLTPYLAAEHTRLRSEGFSEGGAAGFGLRTEAWEARRSQAIAGLRMAADWRGLRLHGYGEWQEVLDASGFAPEASFVGVDAWAPLVGSTAAESGGVFGLGVEAGLGRAAAVGLGYDQRFGPRGRDRMVSLRYVLGF